MKAKTKTIDIQAKEWFDKINGNSYWAAKVTVNFGLKTVQTFTLPFQYGYERSYKDTTLKELKERGIITTQSTSDLRDQKIILRSNIERNCLKRELMAIV